MNLFVAGLSYKTAPVAVREKLAVHPSLLSCHGCRVKLGAGLDEVVLLSTCNRVEVYGTASKVNGNVHRLDWVIRQGRAAKPLTLPDGSPLTVSFDLEMPGAAPVFQKGFLSGLGCVARVAQ